MCRVTLLWIEWDEGLNLYCLGFGLRLSWTFLFAPALLRQDALPAWRWALVCGPVVLGRIAEEPL